MRIGSHSATRTGKGIYVSSCNVLDSAYKIRVSTDSEILNARIVAQDRQRNLCLIATTAIGGSEIEIEPTLPSVGGRVFAIANTAGFGIGISEGVVSGIRRFQDVDYLQFTAPIGPGASGGALVDDSGRLLGIIDYRNRYGQNVNFAVVAASIAEVAPRSVANVAQAARFDRARSLLVQTDWAALEALASTWAGDEPDNRDAWQFLTRAASALRHSDSEIKAWRALRRIQPDSVDFGVGLGEVLLAQGMYDESLELGRQLAVQHQEDGRIHWLLARSLHATAQYGEASSEYRKAIALDPGLLGAYQGLATLAQIQGDTTTAIEIWRRLSGLYPDAQAPHIGLMQAYLSARRPALAYAVLEDMSEQERTSALGWYWRGTILASLGCPEQAVAAYRKSIDLGFVERDSALAGIGSAMADMGRLPEAIIAYRSATEVNPDRPEWRYQLAVQLKDGGRPAEALVITQDLTRRYPAVAAYWRQHGFVLAVLSRPKDAIPAMEHSLQIDAKQAKLWTALIATYQSAGRRKDALEAQRRLKEVDSERADAAYRSYILPFEGERR